MYDPEMRKDCQMRGNLGNCSPVGGFCMDAVSDEICEAVHNAYNHGFYNAVRTLKEQEAVEPYSMNAERTYGICPRCGKIIFRYGNVEENHYCGVCGKKVKWK